mmetsp:Transcript_1561/g.3141  ORF Transcript_1561/g.3141 Transcript_1561/m.3141 type:complete len:140 (-) Transcript_1561:145-564(-)
MPLNFIICYCYQLPSQPPKKKAKGPAEECSDDDTLEGKVTDTDVNESTEADFAALIALNAEAKKVVYLLHCLHVIVNGRVMLINLSGSGQYPCRSELLQKKIADVNTFPFTEKYKFPVGKNALVHCRAKSSGKTVVWAS